MKYGDKRFSVALIGAEYASGWDRIFNKAMRRIPDETKAAQGTLRPSRVIPSPVAARLERWPAAPKGFSDTEKAAWKRPGQSVMPLGTVSAGDLLMARYCAQMMARADKALADPEAKLTAINSLLRIVAGLLKDFGLTPTSRNSVSTLAALTEDEDEIGEFEV